MNSTQYVSQVRLRRDDVPSFDAYPFSLPAVRHLDVLELHPRITFLVGENGSGKSTLLEAIAVSWGFNPEGGTRNFVFGTRPPIPNCINISVSQRASDGLEMGFSFGSRVSSM
jgi:predicted ATPase